jgi:tRNA nucleotidyltransferase (CCA-adding enzyme)
MNAGGWEHFSHGADIGVRGFGATKAVAFEQVARALTAVVSDCESIAADEVIAIQCEAEDDELLLLEWLNSLIYEMATRHMLFGKFHVELFDHRLTATASGEKIDASKHQPAVEVKGATLTCIQVARQPDGQWLAQSVVDV